jgi:hypothetical protein
MKEKRKFPTATDVIANMPRRDNNGPDKGGGDPHMNCDDKPLSESETWKSHKPTKQSQAEEEGMTRIRVKSATLGGHSYTDDY